VGETSKFKTYNFGLGVRYLAKFSGVGFGKRSAVKELAFFMLPLIFIFPYNKLTNINTESNYHKFT